MPRAAAAPNSRPGEGHSRAGCGGRPDPLTRVGSRAKRGGCAHAPWSAGYSRRMPHPRRR
eukprot:318306-Chlamydomonas_euryale.AAC.2